MTPLDALPIVLALIAGLGLGVIYFGGLWLTVRRLPSAGSPAALATASLFGRLAIVAAGLYAIALAKRWELLVAAMAGMLVVRFVFIRKLRAEQRETIDHAP